MQAADWPEVAALIHDSTNGWYQTNRNHLIFAAGPTSTMLFCEVYEALDPGCCLIARDSQTERILGSCFYHPRETHFSLGIMNVHPDAFGRGVGRALLQEVVHRADAAALPLRLVSSAMNLDSFSLYNKAGFVPREIYQDMIIEVPENGLNSPSPTHTGSIRSATLADVPAIGKLELDLAHVRREQDYVHFIENRSGDWNLSVLELDGQLMGWIGSIVHPASNMVGPGIARDQASASALLWHELNHRRGQTMVSLLPVTATDLVAAAYQWGAKNCELHFSQVRGKYQVPNGIVLPTFMPETS